MGGNGSGSAEGTVFAARYRRPADHPHHLKGAYSVDPSSNLILSGGLLYRLTFYGGTYGAGMVFSLPVTGGTLTTLYSFNGTTDGRFPGGNLSLANGVLYGTTLDNWTYNAGTLFGVPATGGSVKILANFNDSNSGDTFIEGVTADGNSLYGTRYGGGDLGEGSVYSVALSAPEPASWLLGLLAMSGFVSLSFRVRRKSVTIN